MLRSNARCLQIILLRVLFDVCRSKSEALVRYGGGACNIVMHFIPVGPDTAPGGGRDSQLIFIHLAPTRFSYCLSDEILTLPYRNVDSPN